MTARTRSDQLKLYLIEKTCQVFGTEAVSRVIDDGFSLKIYFYTNDRHSSAQDELERTIDILKPSLFAQPYGGIDVQHTVLKNHGSKDERLFCLLLTGALTDIADNVEKNDKDVFDRAQKSHWAEQVLRREEKKDLARGGI